jgi:hypothetical protein
MRFIPARFRRDAITARAALTVVIRDPDVDLDYVLYPGDKLSMTWDIDILDDGGRATARLVRVTPCGC